MPNGAEEHHYSISWVVFAGALGFVIVAFLYWRFQVQEDRQAAEEAAQTEEVVDTEVASERDAVLSPVQDASEGASAVVAPDVPSVNPVDAVNPFQQLKTNPFSF